MASFTPNPAGYAMMRAILEQAVRERAEGLGDQLRQHLSQAGTGRQYRRLPNRSSRPGEYPAIQSGDLRGAVDVRRVGWGVYRIGFWDAPEYTAGLEFKPPSRGGRAPMRRFIREVKMQP